MARLLTSLLLAAILAALAGAQSFGRFGYGGTIDLPGLTLGHDGFSAKAPGSTHFNFVQESRLWEVVNTSDVEQTIGLSNMADCPYKISCNLYAPGFRMYCPNGFALKMDCAKNPFITWLDGSVGDGVPTPNLKWSIVSFQDDQPPILLVFEVDHGPSVSVRGKPGDWTLASDRLFAGWVHVCLPTGTKPFKTNSAATLGALSQKFLSEQSFWLAPPAHLVDRTLISDALSVTCTWQFDRPGVVVPAPATFARLGGYPLSVSSRTRPIYAVDENGPILVTDQESLSIRFPVRRVPTGRFLAEGKPLSSPPATVSPLDVPSVAELAMANLVGSSDGGTRKLGDETLAGYFDHANYFAEPTTGQQLPFDAAGNGIDLAAAHSFLMQSLTNSRQSSSDANSLLTTLQWRTDWLTWRLWVPDAVLERRAGALAALAGALCPEPERRLQAAMLQAGLASERGLNIYRRRVGELNSEPLLLEPLEGVRQVLFALEGKLGGVEQDFAKAMLGEIRVFGETPAYLVRKEDALSMIWDSHGLKTSVFTLASAYPLTFERGGNLVDFDAKDALGFTRIEFRSQTPGLCDARLNLPAYAKPPPGGIDVPQYSENPR